MKSRVDAVLDLRSRLVERAAPQSKPMSRVTREGTKLLMKKVKYKVSPTNKDEESNVEGIALNRWVAIREPVEDDGSGEPVQSGWFVDHIPTGFAIAQGLPNKKAAMLIGKSFIDMVPESIQRMDNPHKLIQQIDKAHAKDFFMYAKEVKLKRTNLEFSDWAEKKQ
jgi:hypothetical protein